MSGVKPVQSVIEYQIACANGHTTKNRKIASGSPRNTRKKLTRSKVSGRRDLLRAGGAVAASVRGTREEAVT